MSYKYFPEDIEGIRKVKWDQLWHVIYKKSGKETYDRVDRKEAMSVLKKIEKDRLPINWKKCNGGHCSFLISPTGKAILSS